MTAAGPPARGDRPRMARFVLFLADIGPSPVTSIGRQRVNIAGLAAELKSDR